MLRSGKSSSLFQEGLLAFAATFLFSLMGDEEKIPLSIATKSMMPGTNWNRMIKTKNEMKKVAIRLKPSP
jgi:hypothetical protein